MSSSDSKKLRELGARIYERAQSDAEFKKQLKADPKEALKAASLPEAAIDDFMAEAKMADVAGHSAQNCIFTINCQISIVWH